MLFRIHVPGPPLRGLIESFTLVVDPEYPYEREQLLPDGRVYLLINLGPHEHFAVLPGETRRRPYRRAWLSGERRGPTVIERARHGYDLVIVQFRPGAASAFFGFPLSEVTDRVVELEEIWGRSAVDEMVSRLLERPDPNRRLAELERILGERLLGSGPSPLICGALGLMDRADLAIGMREIASRLGASQTTVIREFRQHVGLTPKLLQRILRFQRAIALESTRSLTWTQIAHRCGYYDQAHMSREFRIFADRSPGAYSAARAEYPNYVPVP
ncbi:MAG TPA: AraC family transcriptional regulator [Longimicrobiaceae bacterium]|nr:AraC family transcriptional regulator [Longimicrobiaceae bacterium]